jgi:hypothetical protein
MHWDSRQELLAHLDRSEHATIIETFEAVGTSRDVQLAADDKARLLEVIEGWRSEVGDDRLLPAGIMELRHALEQDVHDDDAASTSL